MIETKPVFFGSSTLATAKTYLNKLNLWSTITSQCWIGVCRVGGSSEPNKSSLDPPLPVPQNWLKT